MYTGSKPRRQSDKLLATICASFRLGGCNRTAEPSARVATKSTRSVMNARLGSFSGNTSAANSWMGVRKICLAWVWRAKCADLAKPRLVDLSCGADGSHWRPDPCRPAPAP